MSFFGLSSANKSGVEMASFEIAAEMWLKHLRPALNRKHIREINTGRENMGALLEILKPAARK